jgi:hypothetical protein
LQNFKCNREGCGKGFKEQAQFDAHMEIHRMRECHLCGKVFQRKQVNRDVMIKKIAKKVSEKMGVFDSKQS